MRPSKLRVKFSHLSVPIKVSIVGGIVLLVLATFSFLTYTTPESILRIFRAPDDIAAVVRGKKVTKAEYEILKNKYKSVGEYSDNSDIKNNPGLHALNFLILEKALEDEAQKQGITVTDEEVEKRYQSVVKLYKNEEALLRTTSLSYGWGGG